MHSHHIDAWDHTHAWPDSAIAATAAGQQTIVTHRQLRALGVAPRTIAAAAARGRLHRVHHGVYSMVLPAARPALAPEWAALLACGPTALLSHHSAAWVLGLRDTRPSCVTVTVVAADRRRPALRIHRVRELPAAERVRHSGLVLTSPARVLLDLAPTEPERALEHLLDRTLRRTSPTRIRETMERHRGRPGAARVLALLDPARPSTDTWSRAEEKLFALLRRAGVPLPECNVLVGRYRPDLTWRAQRVIVEYDSAAYHSGPAAVRWDTERHNELTALGYAVIHVTWNELSRHPERVLVQIATALARAER